MKLSKELIEIYDNDSTKDKQIFWQNLEREFPNLRMVELKLDPVTYILSRKHDTSDNKNR